MYVIDNSAGVVNEASGSGNDTLTERAGLDVFRFNAAPSTSNIDTVTDFKIGTAAADANDFIIYNVGTGALSYDAAQAGQCKSPSWA
ncbi:M10 family metallopeptidase C-terminal domain-containing protein [Methylovulum psychrotolerans]|uniref:Peptidase M10 serralysin C-terminal domain-containing protein n=1 Tax=Methylovulum psychrotolerans TaxID=1704499 RepID=A0A2S5CFS5_9GAMM|nr:hypothetical protein [Methylovulum psychrotolerans]POZ49650.1 hypothetical protein AADEFJLK_04579 [Methylovulum psychrotolerans]